MSDTPDDDDIFTRAGQYVLGVLEPDEIAELALLVLRDRDFAEAVAAWEQRLAPLSRLVTDVAPPPALWPRIEAALRPRPRVRVQAMQAISGLQPAWLRALLRPAIPWAVAGVLAAVAIPLIVGPMILARDGAGSVRVAAITALAGTLAAPSQGGWIAKIHRDGTIDLASIGTIARPSGRDLELWALADGAAAPVPLGLIPATAGKSLPAQALPKGAFKLLVSVEPTGGSATGLPTGPVVYGGTVSTD